MSKLLEAARQIRERNDRSLAALQREGRSKGDGIVARVDGHRRLLRLTIEPPLVHPRKIRQLEKGILEALNAAMTKMNSELRSRLGDAAASLPRWLG